MSEQAMNQNQTLSLDDIEDVPGFDTPPSGEYLCALSMEIKTLGGKPKLEFKFELREVISLGQVHTEKPSMPGQKFSVLTNFDETGLKYSKKHLVMAKEALGCDSDIQSIVESTKDLPVKVVFNYKTSTSINDKTGLPYENLTIVSMTAA